MPGSVTDLQGTPSSSQMNGSRMPIVAAPGVAGRYYIAYPGGYPTLSNVLLWQVGSQSAITIADDPNVEHSPVALAADATGRPWVFWVQPDSAGDRHVFARRVGASGLEPVVDLGAPAGTSSITALDGSVSPSGDPEALALTTLADGTSGTYYDRGPLLATVPAPVNGHAVNLWPVSGKVLVKLKGQNHFTALTAGEQIPVGSTVDTTHGKVLLASAKSGKAGEQSADFYDGRFVVSQQHGKSVTNLKLTGGDFGRCGSHHAADRGRPVARVARHRPVRHLWGSGHGSFTTSGQNASASVRGTIWLIQDDCDGTLVRVKLGVVSVRDFVRHKTITVRAPHSYFAAR